jgi:hypothetical protein
MWPHPGKYGTWRRIDWFSVIDVSEKLPSPLQGLSKKSNLHGRNVCTVKATSGLANRHKRNHRIAVQTRWIEAGLYIITAGEVCW